MAKPFDSDRGYSGQEYHRDAEVELGKRDPSGAVASEPSRLTDEDKDSAIPPDNGRRASFDPVTGEVRGSGSGAGGGNPGEDFASDPAAGDGYPQTGGERR